MEQIKIGVLTVSDRCAKNEAVDKSGPALVEMIGKEIIKKGVVVKTDVVPDDIQEIEAKLKDWCDDEKIHVILTTGGTGIGPRDVTPEATTAVLNKVIPGIQNLIFKRSSEVTPLAALSRGVAGVRGQSLIINLPGSKKACTECLKFVSNVIPHSVDLINNVLKDVEEVHANLADQMNLRGEKAKVLVNSSRKLRKSLYDPVEVSKAQEIVTTTINFLVKKKEIYYEEGLGYVLSKDEAAQDSLPPFNVSICDGYAIMMGDVNCKEVVAVFGTGIPPDPTIQLTPSTCVKVSTGGPIPLNTEAVVRVESTKIAGKNDDGTEKKIFICTFPCKGADIRLKGSDFKKGEVLVTTGTLLDSYCLGLLGAAGRTVVEVYDKPIVGILSTGDELISPTEKPTFGKVRDSNRVMLLSLLKEEGFKGLDLGLVRDEPEFLLEALIRGFRVADVVVTTGSMSMGEKDYLKDLMIEEFGAEIHFGRVFVKPGLPTAFGVLEFEGQLKTWFGLPGNPASAAVTTHLFVLPALRKASGFSKCFPLSLEVTLLNDLEVSDRPHYQRGILSKTDKGFFAATIGSQNSSRIGSFVNANCLIIVPQNRLLKKGQYCDVLFIGKNILFGEAQGTTV